MCLEDSNGARDEALAETLRQRIHTRSGGRLCWLQVELRAGQVVLHGASPSYYVIQLALVAVREVLPEDPIELDIQVVASRPRAPEGHDRDLERFPWRQDPAGPRRPPRSERSPKLPLANPSAATERLLDPSPCEPYSPALLLNGRE